MMSFFECVILGAVVLQVELLRTRHCVTQFRDQNMS